MCHLRTAGVLGSGEGTEGGVEGNENQGLWKIA